MTNHTSEQTIEPKKIIIAGTRKLPRGTTSHEVDVMIQCAVDSLQSPIAEIVSGNSGAIDLHGEAWARDRSIPIKRFPADWSQGRKAGPLRNRQMAEYADVLIAIWDGSSRGTKNMIEEMEKLGKPVILNFVGARACWHGAS